MGKHFNNQNKTKKINKMKFFITLLIIIGICILIYFKFIKSNNQEFQETVSTQIDENVESDEQISNIENVIETAFSALKTSNIEEAKKYLNYEKLISIIDENILNQDGEVSNIEKNLFNDMSWSIEKITITDTGATALVELTNKSYKDIILNWLQNMVDVNEEEGTITNERGFELLEDVLTNDNSVQEKTTIQRITINIENDTYTILVDDDLRDLLFPGIDSVINEIE